MAVDPNHLWETLYPAAWRMARSADPIKVRVGEAFRAIRHLRGEEFPPEFRILYNGIVERMTRAGPLVENGAIVTGAVARTLETMGDDYASEVAEDVFKLFVEVAELHFRALGPG